MRFSTLIAACFFVALSGCDAIVSPKLDQVAFFPEGYTGESAEFIEMRLVNLEGTEIEVNHCSEGVQGLIDGDWTYAYPRLGVCPLHSFRRLTRGESYTFKFRASRLDPAERYRGSIEVRAKGERETVVSREFEVNVLYSK